MITSMKPVTPQAKTIYKLLSKKGALSAQQIGEELGVLPNAVYRSADKLIGLGMVCQLDSYPVQYKAVPANVALNWYLLAAAQGFRQEFSVTVSSAGKTQPSPSITFIKDRQSLLKRTNNDTTRSRDSINFIVSGIEVPDETILAYRKAITKGAKVRVLVQRKQETTTEKLEKWQDIGAAVRQSENIGVRLFVFDSRVVYFTSYNAASKGKAFGIRFEYEPLANLMNELFEQHWQASKPLR